MTNEEHLHRLEQVVHSIAEDQLAFQKLIADSAKDTRSHFHQVADELRDMGAETDRRFRETDGRIDKLVLAIGELIRSRPQ